MFKKSDVEVFVQLGFKRVACFLSCFLLIYGLSSASPLQFSPKTFKNWDNKKKKISFEVKDITDRFAFTCEQGARVLTAD